MVESTDRGRRDRAYQKLFMRSFKRLKRRGATDDEAGAVAREVADKSTARMKAPVFRTDEEFSELVTTICSKLGAGMSYYELFGALPYLARGRVDRIVAVATQTKPPVETALARAAKRATGMERLSGGIAVLLFSLALGTLGLWYAMAVGAVVCIGSELYEQVWMPRSLRRRAAMVRIPAVVFAAATVALIFLAYRWYDGVEAHPYLLACAAAVAVVAIAFVIPGLVLARLVSRHESAWRKELERTLLEKRGSDAGRKKR